MTGEKGESGSSRIIIIDDHPLFRKGAANLVGIYAALADMEKSEVLAEFGGQGFGVFKPALAELAVEKLAPINEEMKRLMANEDEIDAILRKGAERARAIAGPIMARVKEIVGFVS
jgi:tryptophanyl-tRNA synthetase